MPHRIRFPKANTQSSADRLVYSTLDALRQRPAMFLGNGHRRQQFGKLHAFIIGWRTGGSAQRSIVFWEFNRWITSRVRGLSSNLPWDHLEKRLGSVAVFDAYFRYLDEFKGCEEVEVARPEGTTLVSRVLRLKGGEMVPVSPPDRLYAGQFAPSGVFYLGEVYGDIVDRRFPYHRTVKGVFADAKACWSVPVSAWQQCPPRPCRWRRRL